jgi:hypothetical protein
MKSDLVHSKVQMEPAILENLVREVKETVATGVNLAPARKRSFGALDLWAIRRRRRYIAHTRKQPAIITGSGY